jgi:solute:Na+ symporter, SSS family
MRILKVIFIFLLGFQQIGSGQNAPDLKEGNILKWQKIASFSAEETPLQNLNNAFVGSHNGAIFIADGSGDSINDSLQGVGYQNNRGVFVFAQNEAGEYEKVGKEFKLPFGSFEISTTIQTSFGWVIAGVASPLAKKRNVFVIKWNSELQVAEFDTLPSLDDPNTFFSGTFFGNKIYLAGGNDFFLSLDLSKNGSQRRWEQVVPNRPSGIFPVFASQSNGLDNCLYLFGQIDSTEFGKNNFKSDFQFNPKTGDWKKLNQVPFHLESSPKAVANNFISVGSTDILYFDQFGRKSFLYHTITDNWENVGAFPSNIQPFAFFKKENKIFAFCKEGINANDARLTLYELYFENEKQNFGFLNSLVLVFYFVLLIILGFYFSSKQKDSDDYFKGGKRIPWWAAGLSLYGTGLSAITFMAVPAKTYATDWAYFMTKLPQILIPIIVCWLFIPFYRKLDITTAYEYLEKRFNLATRMIGSLSFIIFQLGRIGIVLYLPAIALNVATGMDIILCILLMGAISLIYTIMGGIEAVIWTDVMQVIILIGGIILCLVLISFSLEGGVKEIIEIGKQNEKFEIFDMALDFSQPTFWVVVLGGFFSQLIVYSTDQSMVQRYLTTKDLKDAKRSIWTSTLVSLSIGWVYFFVGTALFAFYKNNPSELLPAMQTTDAIFPWYIFSQLPDGVNGLLIAGIFAAAMSSLSSSMNSAATAYTVDFHQVFRWKGNALMVGRASTFVIGIAGISFALMFATMDVKSIWDEFLKIIGLITGGLGGVFLLGIISTRANGVGALVGLFGSGIVQFFVANQQPVHFLLFTATGFISCFIIGYFVSLLFPNRSKPIAGLTIYSDK